MAELLVGEIPKGELIHPNGFYIVAIFYEDVILKNFGQILGWVQRYVQTQQPYWIVATCTSGKYKDVARDCGLAPTVVIETTAQMPKSEVFAVRVMGEFPDSRLAVAFSFVPVGIKEIIDGYPWRTNGP